MRVAVVGDPELVDACAPAERVAPDAADVVLALGAAPDFDGPRIVWGDGEAPAGLRAQDRFVATAPGVDGAWRTMPLPVADAVFDSLAPAGERGVAAWLTPDGPRRRHYLDHFEHAARLLDPPAAAPVAVNLHDGDEPAFEARAVRALAAGQLLVSETLAPAYGLEPGIDYLEARDLGDLFVAVESAAADPGAFRRVRLRGRRKAEWFRASRVVARLAHDLEVELAAR